jgi:diguanylate cyclase (GGDEF)-like protein/PAS domain S-box-containing protein
LDESLDELLADVAAQGIAFSEADHWRLMELSPMAIEIVRADGTVPYINPSAQRLFRRSRAEYATYNAAQSYVDPADRIRVLAALRAEGRIQDMEVQFRRGDGERIWLSLSAMLMHSAQGPMSFVWFQDVTARRRSEERLAHAAAHDGLTDLPNRLFFAERLDEALRASEQDGTRAALLLLDLDGFKTVNDRHGHASGDVLLRVVADRLRGEIRAGDTVARLGGDEFALLFPGARKVSPLRLARRLHRKIGEAILLGEEITQVGGSIGIALFPTHGVDATTLMKCADAAMYAAKRAGGGCRVYGRKQGRRQATALPG